MTKFINQFLIFFGLGILLIVNSHAGEITPVNLRILQTRIYKTTDWRKIVEAIDTTNKQFGFASQFIASSDLRFCPARFVEQKKGGIPFIFETRKYRFMQLNVMYKPNFNSGQTELRVTLQIESPDNKTIQTDEKFYSAYHKVLSDNLFVEGLNLEFQKLN